MDEFKPGDVVVLKSDNGNPKIFLTVDTIKDGFAHCVYRTGSEFKQAVFNPATLKKPS